MARKHGHHPPLTIPGAIALTLCLLAFSRCHPSPAPAAELAGRAKQEAPAASIPSPPQPPCLRVCQEANLRQLMAEGSPTERRMVAAWYCQRLGLCNQQEQSR